MQADGARRALPKAGWAESDLSRIFVTHETLNPSRAVCGPSNPNDKQLCRSFSPAQAVHRPLVNRRKCQVALAVNRGSAEEVNS